MAVSPSIRAASFRAGRSLSNAAGLQARFSATASSSSPCTLTGKLLIYALGRGLERVPTARPSTEITHRMETSGYGFQTLVREVVRSLPFQSRRAEAVKTVVAAKPVH